MRKTIKNVLTLTVTLLSLLCAGQSLALTLNEAQKLLAEDGAPFDSFGFSVAIDGDTAVIGAPAYVFAEEDSGSAYVYTHDGNGVWTLQQKLTAPESTPLNRFGFSVAIDGDTALIGADGEDNYTGSAYVYTRDGNGVWTLLQPKLTAEDRAVDDSFGYSVAIDGDTAVIGALFDDDQGKNSGSAYVFARDGVGGWSQQQKITAADGETWDMFGIVVATDGDTVLIGAYGDDYYTGSAYVYTRSAGVWTQQQKLTAVDGAENDKFGFSVAIDGDTAVIGAFVDDDFEDELNEKPDSGSAYVYTRSAGVWSQQQKIIAEDGEAFDRFGLSVAIDGDTAVIGAMWDDDKGQNSGSAYVYTRDGDGVWSELVKLLASDGSEGDFLGFYAKSVAISGVTVLAGAPRDEDFGTRSGSGYVFVLSDPDSDGDGIPDDVDNCPDTANAAQTDTDGDFVGDACDSDDDGDGVPDGTDNCPLNINPDQEDFDSDGAGDYCDSDDDGDDVLDADDACLFTPAAAITNTDGCAIADLCPCIHPDGLDKWKNHGKFVSCVAHAANDFRDAGLISDSAHGGIVSEAGQSVCGVKN